MKVSKFSSLVQAKQPLPQSPEETNLAKLSATSPVTVSPIVKVADEKVLPNAPISVATKDKIIDMQPSRGKKGHHDYNQVTIYLRKETHKKAKIALLQSGDERDFSEFVEDLLVKHFNGLA